MLDEWASQSLPRSKERGKGVTLYLPYWDNGLDYEAWEQTLLGVYTSAEARNRARESYARLIGRQWPFNDYMDAGFKACEVEADAPLVEVHPDVRKEMEGKPIP